MGLSVDKMYFFLFLCPPFKPFHKGKPEDNPSDTVRTCSFPKDTQMHPALGLPLNSAVLLKHLEHPDGGG